MAYRPFRGSLRRAACLLLASVALACGSPAASSFDPGAPCSGADEQRAPGAYPELGALIPREFEGRPLVELESGRYCSTRTLGSLVEAGVHELRFAGATWPASRRSGLALAFFEAPGLTLDALADSFALGAGAARRVTNVRARETRVATNAGTERAIRIDAFNNGRPQTVVLWNAGRASGYKAVIASEVDEAHLERAIRSFATYSPGT